MMTSRRLKRFAARLARNRRGAAAVELALVAPMLVGIVLPMVDLGMGAFARMRVQNAAEAGAQYVLAHGYNSTAITNAVQAATSLGNTVSVAPATACHCVTSNTLGSAVTCGSACADGSTAGNYATITATVTFTPLFSYGGFGSARTLTGTAMTRY